MSLTISILPGLQTYGPEAQRFSATGFGLHSEGFVVHFSGEGFASWTGNFVRGFTQFDAAQKHPNGTAALVIAGGQAYVVDPFSKALLETFGGGIVEVFPGPTPSHLVLNHQNISFELLGPTGHVWRSRRLSWGGFRNIQIAGSQLSGDAWAFDDTWHAFTVNLNDGSSIGGAYSASAHSA